MPTWNIRLATEADELQILACFSSCFLAHKYPIQVVESWTLETVRRYFRRAPYIWVAVDTEQNKIRAFSGFSSVGSSIHVDPYVFPCDEAVIGFDTTLSDDDVEEVTCKCFGHEAQWLLENTEIKYLERTESINELCKPSVLMDSWKHVLETWGETETGLPGGTFQRVRYDIRQCYNTLKARGWL